MSPPSHNLLHGCLFFTANRLARVISRVADEEFGTVGLSPTQAFLLMLVAETPGCGQSDLGRSLALAPSTVTRAVDALERRGVVRRETAGKVTRVFPTPPGLERLPSIQAAWKRIHRRYSDILGEREGEALTSKVNDAARELEAE